MLTLRILSIAAAAAYLMAMRQDLLYRRIPNAVPIVIVLIAALKWAAIGQVQPALAGLATAAVVFIVTLGMLHFNWLGGGDVKLISATCLLVGAGDTMPFLLAMALIGGALSLVVLVHARLTRRATFPSASAGAAIAQTPAQAPAPRPTVPYALAIGGGAIWLLFLQSFQG